MSVNPESQPDSTAQTGQDRKLIGFQRPLQTIKRVSGKLSRLLHGPKKNTEQSRRLLIVDDEQSICFSMNEYFTQLGFQVDTASEVEQAERYISTAPYEVIIQDLRLGAGSTEGLEIIRFAHQHSPDTKIVVLTAYGTAEIEDEARRSGALAFLRKPQPLSQVAQVVRGLIESPADLRSH
jgi:DNA-binding NtrC family response regulator